MMSVIIVEIFELFSVLNNIYWNMYSSHKFIEERDRRPCKACVNNLIDSYIRKSDNVTCFFSIQISVSLVRIHPQASQLILSHANFVVWGNINQIMDPHLAWNVLEIQQRFPWEKRQRMIVDVNITFVYYL
jgi:hypothetical protein